MGTKVILVRYGNAVVPDGQPDSARRLSEISRRQVQALRDMLRKDGFNLNSSDVVGCSSPMDRAVETVSIITGCCESDIIRMPELFTPQGEEGEILNEMFRRIGYEPLSSYFNDRCHAIKGWQALMVYSFRSWQAISDLIDKRKPEILIAGGHAVLLPLTAFLPCRGAKIPTEALCNDRMPEAGAIILDVENGKVVDLKILPEVGVLV